jgi:thioredoxin 1
MATLVLTDDTFETELQRADAPLIVFFSAEWSAAARRMKAELDGLAATLGGSAKVARVDIDESPETSRRLGIHCVPTTILFKEGKAKATSLDAMSQADMAAWLRS